MKFTHTNLITHDWQRLAEFYIDVFQCQIKPPVRKQSGDWLSKGTGVLDAALEGVHLILPGYKSDGPTLEIYSYEKTLDLQETQPNQRGIGHLAFEVADVESVLQTVINHGGSKNGEISETVVDGVGKITFVYARDPDGNLIELQHWDYN